MQISEKTFRFSLVKKPKFNSFEALMKNLKLNIFDHFLFYIYIFRVAQTLYIQSIHMKAESEEMN